MARAKPPSLRAFHLDLKWQHYRFERYLDLLADLADWGYNAVVLEYENMFPYTACPRARHREAWTRRQVRAFVEKARSLDVQVIPLIQCFGHLEFVLRLPEYRHLAERSEHPSELCPCKDGAADLVHAMIAEVLDAHPEAEYIHIGGDEVWSLGTCPACKRSVKREGKSRLYIDFVNPFIEQVLAAGKRPILWADMLEGHPEALDELRRDVVLCDWEYWPQGVVEPNLLDWSSATWVTPMSLPTIEPATRRRFRSHWAPEGGKHWPLAFDGWPYVGYLQKAGFEVVTGSAIKCNGDNYSSVRYRRHVHNSLSAAAAASRAGAIGQIVTCWAIRRAPLENQYLAAALAGEGMLRPGQVDAAAFAADYERKRFGEPMGLLDGYETLGAMVFCLNMTNFGRYTFEEHAMEPSTVADDVARAGGGPGRTPPAMREAANEGLHAAQRVLESLDAAQRKGRELDVLRFSAEEVRYKAWLVYAVCERLRGRPIDGRAVLKQTNRLKALLKETFADDWTAWTIRDELHYRYSPDEAWARQA